MELPPPIYAVAARLRAIERGHKLEPQLMPRIRLRTAAGRWLTVHASRMTGPSTQAQTAIFLEEARPVEIAPLILSAHQLTARESEITQLVQQGMSTAEISDRLCITLNTVQDFFKAIFDKVGVRSPGGSSLRNCSSSTICRQVRRLRKPQESGIGARTG